MIAANIFWVNGNTEESREFY